jgi:murein DD-endopeptidase MepM/ murein hydrolase activator NlpD
LNNGLALKKKRIPLLIISGVLLTVGLVILMNLEPPKDAIKTQAPKALPASAPAPPITPKVTAEPESTESKPPDANPDAAVVTVQPLGAPADSEVPASATNTPPAASMVNEADIATLKLRELLIPVAGITARQLRDTFNDGRSEGRQHQALDIMAASGTPVLAAADGKVAKLFQSDKGGITLYELDASGLYYYYYAHLQSYADQIVEGKQLKRGDVIAYVGDTGNAGAGNFHLHFAISKPTAPGKWSGGTPINPYPLLVNP